MKWGVLLMLLVASPLSAQRIEVRWSRGDLAWGLGASAAIGADCVTTRVGMQHGKYERNFLLGSHPSSGRINSVCGLAVIGTWGIAHFLGTKDRKYWLVAVTAVELFVTVRNLRQLR